jgi:hypothetical protein
MFLAEKARSLCLLGKHFVRCTLRKILKKKGTVSELIQDIANAHQRVKSTLSLPNNQTHTDHINLSATLTSVHGDGTTSNKKRILPGKVKNT